MALQSKVGRSGPWQPGESEPANTLFGPTSDSNVSHAVTIDDDPIVVRAFNLVDGDVVLVEMVDGEGAGRYFAPFCPNGMQACLTNYRNVLPIAIPGRYRFVLHRDDGAPPPVGLAVVRYHTATMSHEWLTAYLRYW
jgi:hypothetical protein